MKKTVAIVAACTFLAGCAASHKEFYADRQAVSNERLCQTWINLSPNDDIDFRVDVREEAERRGLTFHQCNTIAQASDRNAVLGVAAIILIGAAVAAAGQGGGGGGTPYMQTDTEWDWDQFYDDSYNLVWACRGVQTGQFAESYRCAGKFQADARWSGK